MVTVKLFGLLRMDSGIKEFTSVATSVKELYTEIQQLAAKQGNIISEKNIKSCAVLINGQQTDKKTKLNDGDQVVFMSMVAGG